MIERLLDWESRFVAALPEQERRQGRAAVRLAAGVAPWGVAFAVLFAALGQVGLAISLMAAAVGVGASPWLLRTTGSVRWVAHWINVFFSQSLLYPAWLLGGLFAACIPWLAVCIVFATFISGRRAGVVWAVISVALMALGFGLQVSGYVPEPVVTPTAHLFLAMTAHQGLFVLAVALSWAVSSSAERHAQELSAALQRADDASQAKSAFLASMSHELRTPMNAVIGYAELLMEEAEASDAEDLSRIRDAGQHLLHLVNDVLDLSKVEAGRMAFEHEPVELVDLAEEVLVAARPLIDAGGNGSRVEGQGPVWALGDRMRLKQVLLNLVSNAAKFTASGEIRLRVLSTSEGAVVEVIDTGEGMSPEEAEHIFEPFIQARGDVERTHGGTGLGLALVREFVQRMEGSVSVHSARGVGTTVRLQLLAP